MKNIIYYFSGTGNSLRAAIKIAERIGGAEIKRHRNRRGQNGKGDCLSCGNVSGKPEAELVTASLVCHIFSLPVQ